MPRIAQPAIFGPSGGALASSCRIAPCVELPGIWPDHRLAAQGTALLSGEFRPGGLPGNANDRFRCRRTRLPQGNFQVFMASMSIGG